MPINTFYTISDVARILGISDRTLKNYENQGKIPKARRDPKSRWRIYTDEDIQKLKALFFTPKAKP